MKKCPLAPYQLQILSSIARGDSDQMIESELHLSKHVISEYVTRIKRKIKARNRVHAVVIALREGWIEFPKEDI